MCRGDCPDERLTDGRIAVFMLKFLLLHVWILERLTHQVCHLFAFETPERWLTLICFAFFA